MSNSDTEFKRKLFMQDDEEYSGSCWVYVRSEPSLFTVGFYSPDGCWNTDSDWGTKEEAAQRVHWLNGGQP